MLLNNYSKDLPIIVGNKTFLIMFFGDVNFPWAHLKFIVKEEQRARLLRYSTKHNKDNFSVYGVKM